MKNQSSVSAPGFEPGKRAFWEVESPCLFGSGRGFQNKHGIEGLSQKRLQAGQDGNQDLAESHGVSALVLLFGITVT
jgi:hypothetical protein